MAQTSNSRSAAELENYTTGKRTAFFSNYQCGQCFRWRAAEKDGRGMWCGMIKNDVICLKEEEENEEETTRSSKISSALHDYFQLEQDLGGLYALWSKPDDNNNSLPSSKLREDFREQSKNITGLRLLRQDPWECFLSFLCSQNNNIPRITSMINNLCKRFGTKVGTIQLDNQQILEFYSFPTLEQMKSATEDDLKNMGFGYRAKYIVNAVAEVSQKEGGVDWLMRLRHKEREFVQKELTSFLGVGQKVADCVALFSLDKLDLVPVDTHVFQIGQRYLPSLSGMKSVNKTTYSVIGNFFRDSFGDLAGWAHTILFAAELPAFITPDGARKRKDTEKRTKTNKGPIKKESRSSHKEVKSVKRKHRGEEEKEETASRRKRQ